MLIDRDGNRIYFMDYVRNDLDYSCKVLHPVLAHSRCSINISEKNQVISDNMV